MTTVGPSAAQEHRGSADQVRRGRSAPRCAAGPCPPRSARLGLLQDARPAFHLSSPSSVPVGRRALLLATLRRAVVSGPRRAPSRPSSARVATTSGDVAPSSSLRRRSQRSRHPWRQLLVSKQLVTLSEEGDLEQKTAGRYGPEEHFCSWLVSLVTIHHALCSLLLFSGPDARLLAGMKPEGPFSSSWFDSGCMFMSFYGGLRLFTQFLPSRWYSDPEVRSHLACGHCFMAPCIWHPLVRCRSGVQDYGFFWETTF